MKYQVNPVCRDSKVDDSLSELDLEICGKWSFDFEGVFAEAMIWDKDLKFYYVNQKVVDGHHLRKESLVKIYNGRQGCNLENSISVRVNYVSSQINL
ncbi:MAG: hypothetical protein KJ905_00805 [Nanoarchaeota archaeon]|nr:hypothetical protein [Nanoarchaeota archaeon]MBU1501298.1 hypothetical protein [Nanoarchaeota archaeon]MBU2459174.1 hypothetical protein [Nanoarchaeota archaeon]